jgi:hypothetical protein
VKVIDIGRDPPASEAHPSTSSDPLFDTSVLHKTVILMFFAELSDFPREITMVSYTKNI